MSKIIGVTVGTPTSPNRIAQEIVPPVNTEDNGKVMIVQEGKWSVGELPQNLRATLELTLKATDWSYNKQSIEANAISENCTLVASPTTESTEAYIASGIMLTEAEVGKIEFTCVTVPTEDIAVLVHVVDPLITAESTEILTFDSVDEMNAYEAEEGAIAMVPSEGESGGDLPVVVYEGVPNQELSVLSDESTAKMEELRANGTTLIFLRIGTAFDYPAIIPLTRTDDETMTLFTGVTGNTLIAVAGQDGAWGVQALTL